MHALKNSMTSPAVRVAAAAIGKLQWMLPAMHKACALGSKATPLVHHGLT